ncbi:MAG TPA: acylphosphatase [Candidatus Acidoferrum sp.]|nr:acylphosphatase [Candidatus Acidoferrum sp.]
MTKEDSGDLKAGRVRAHAWVSGLVQGVYFRAYAEDEAAFRKVAGWIRNAPDGRVEVVLEGSRTSVEAMLQWCHRGSPAARVTGVEVAWEAPRGESGFRVWS